MKTKLFYMGCLMALSMIAFSGCEKDDLTGTGEYIDLGLPSGTLWRDMNEKDGDVTFFTYQEAISKYGEELPTKSQFEELVTSCTWKWKDKYCKVIGPNGKYIILPALGGFGCDEYANSNYYADIDGDFWTSTQASDFFYDPRSWVFSFSLYLKTTDFVETLYCHRLSIRLVKKQ